MSKENPIDKTREGFLSDCDLIVRVPTTYYLKGSRFSNEAAVSLFNNYIDVGIVNGENKRTLEAIYANPKSNFFDPFSKRIIETSLFTDVYLRLENLNGRRVKINDKHRELLKNGTFKLWCPFAIEHPLLNLHEDISTAFGLLAYCLENNINSQEELKKQSWEWQEGIGVDGDDGKIVDIAHIYSSNMPAKKIADVFKFCWLFQDITNGSACFAGLVGVSGLFDIMNFKISFDGALKIEPLIKERNPIKFFDMVENALTRGSIYVNIDSNEESRCSALIGYTEDKKEKFWGSILAPYFFDDFEKISLNLTPGSTPQGTEKWPWKFEFDKGYFAFFAPKNVMKNIKDELRFMQNTWIHYDSDVFEKRGHLSAGIEQAK